jgi:hypothetical protein
MHLGVRKRHQLLVQDRRQAMLLEVEAVRVARQVGDQAEVELDDEALLAIADLPARHLHADAVHLRGDAEGLEHLEGRRMEGAGARIERQPGFGLDHLHRHALVCERQRDAQADRPGTHHQDGITFLHTSFFMPGRFYNRRHERTH